MTPMLITVALGVLLGSVAVTGAMRRYALRHDLLDVPNARSSHARPTPRGGGLAIVLLFFLGELLLRALTVGQGLLSAGALAALAAVAAIGYWDDRHDVPARWRLLVHLAAAALALYSVGPPPLPYWGGALEPGWLWSVVCVLAVAWLVNLYNFMDGIDGIAAVEAVTVLAAAAAVVLLRGGGLPWDVVLLLAATVGFLVWNWPPARIFMGDVGSGFLGAALGVLALATSGGAVLNPWCWLILLGVFVADATVTLVRRFASGQRWYEAHRSHAYQRLSRRLGGHLPVTVGVGAVNLLWLAPLSYAAAVWPGTGWLLALVAYVPLVAAAVLAGAGLPDDT